MQERSLTTRPASSYLNFQRNTQVYIPFCYKRSTNFHTPRHLETINEVDPHPYWEPADGFGVADVADAAAAAAGGVGDAGAGVADADADVVEVGAVASYKHCIYLYLKPESFALADADEPCKNYNP